MSSHHVSIPLNCRREVQSVEQRCNNDVNIMWATQSSLIPRLNNLCGEEEKGPGTHCSHMCQVSLVTCILLRYTKITVNFCLLAEWLQCRDNYTPCETHTGSFEVRNNITLMVTVCIASFKTIGKLQRKRLHQSHAIAFNWNGWTHRRAKSIVHSLSLCCRPHRVWSAASIFHTGEVSMPHGG